MKKYYLTLSLVAVLSVSMISSSCIGSFNMTNSLLSWNKQVGNKFVNELVFFAFWILPAYEISLLADVLVLNSIEFWSGNNPMAQGKSVIEGNDGRYLVDCDGKGYTITREDSGESVRLDFDSEDNAWDITVPGEDTRRLFTFVDGSHISIPAADGTMTVVELSQGGVLAYKAMASERDLAQR